MMKKDVLPIVLPSNVFSLTLALIGFLSFAIPFSLGHPQILVGTIVNAALFSAALFLPKKFIYPIVFLPGLAVLSRGLIFGSLTPFLVVMLPFIWCSNWLLVFIFKKMFNESENYWFSIFSSSLLKFLFLLTSSFLMVKLKFLPKVFLTTMGLLQFITAFLGGILVFLVKKGQIYEKRC